MVDTAYRRGGTSRRPTRYQRVAQTHPGGVQNRLVGFHTGDGVRKHGLDRPLQLRGDPWCHRKIGNSVQYPPERCPRRLSLFPTLMSRRRYRITLSSSVSSSRRRYRITHLQPFLSGLCSRTDYMYGITSCVIMFGINSYLVIR